MRKLFATLISSLLVVSMISGCQPAIKTDVTEEPTSKNAEESAEPIEDTAVENSVSYKNWQICSSPVLSEDLKKSFSEVAGELDGETLQPVALLAVKENEDRTQTYKILCTSSAVYKNVNGAYDLVDFTVIQGEKGRIGMRIPGELIQGDAWQAPDSPEVSEKEVEIFNKTMMVPNSRIIEDRPLAYLGSLSLSGKAYHKFVYAIESVEDGAPLYIIATIEDSAGVYRVTSSFIMQPTETSEATTNAEGECYETGIFLQSKKSPMIYIANCGPVILEDLSEEQKKECEGWETGDIIEVLISVIQESYPGHCYPKEIRYVGHGGYENILADIHHLNEMGWKIENPYYQEEGVYASEDEYVEETSPNEVIDEDAYPDIEEIASLRMTQLGIKLKGYTREGLWRAWGNPDSSMEIPNVVEVKGDELYVDSWVVGEGSDAINVDVQFDAEGKVISGYSYRAADQPTIW